MSDLSRLRSEIIASIVAAKDETALESVRVSALGKKGSVSAQIAALGALSADQRRVVGAEVNALKQDVAEALAQRREELKAQALTARLQRETLDVTLPVRPSGLETGRIHPLS